MSKTIRGIDDEVFRRFKARVKSKDRNIGEALTEAMINWLDTEEKKDFSDYPAWNWGSENLSQDYEEELYGDTA